MKNQLQKNQKNFDCTNNQKLINKYLTIITKLQNKLDTEEQKLMKLLKEHNTNID